MSWVDTTFGEERAVILHADSSDTPDTARRFATTPTRARKVALTGLARGKGAQILAAARRPEVVDAAVVLIADTDTRNPDPAVYRALLDCVREGAALAIADYPRHWSEANLTNHLARSLIAAATGHDVPQPLAGDLAVSRDALAAALRAAETLPTELSACVDGYGIDAFLLLTVAARGPVASVRLDEPKQHAGSFPHLPAFYHQAVPVLLHLTAAWNPLASPGRGPALYRVADRELEPARLEAMLTTLDGLAPPPDGYDERPWPLPAADAWHAVNSGAPASDAARQLWPHYLHRVRDWLTSGQDATTRQRAQQLAAAHTRLHTALIPAGASTTAASTSGFSAFALEPFPELQPGDDLAGAITDVLIRTGTELRDGDIVVVASKVVSITEKRYVDLASVTPSPEAVEISARTGKPAEVVQLVLDSSTEHFLATERGPIIARHILGYQLTSAGIDRAGTEGVWLLPVDPDASARALRDALIT